MDEYEADLAMIRHADLDAIADFFDETGAVEVISMLDETGVTMKQLDNELDVSRAYINDRLTKAQIYDLVRQRSASQTEHGHVPYALTALGQWIQRYMDELGLTDTHEIVRESRAEFEKQKQQFETWIQDTETVETYLESEITRPERIDDQALFKDRDQY